MRAPSSPRASRRRGARACRCCARLPAPTRVPPPVCMQCAQGEYLRVRGVPRRWHPAQHHRPVRSAAAVFSPCPASAPRSPPVQAWLRQDPRRADGRGEHEGRVVAHATLPHAAQPAADALPVLRELHGRGGLGRIRQRRQPRPRQCVGGGGRGVPSQPSPHCRLFSPVQCASTTTSSSSSSTRRAYPRSAARRSRSSTATVSSRPIPGPSPPSSSNHPMPGACVQLTTPRSRASCLPTRTSTRPS